MTFIDLCVVFHDGSYLLEVGSELNGIENEKGLPSVMPSSFMNHVRPAIADNNMYTHVCSGGARSVAKMDLFPVRWKLRGWRCPDAGDNSSWEPGIARILPWSLTECIDQRESSVLHNGPHKEHSDASAPAADDSILQG